MNKNITAIVFAKNEERRLPFVYNNLKDFCEVIVFDGGSTDGTEAFCRENGVKFVSRPVDTSEMGLQSLAWVYENTPTNYVIHVYCSHFYPKQLLGKFSEIANENTKEAVFHDVVVYRYGSVVHRPLVRRISCGCNFYNKKIVDFKESKIHDELAIKFDATRMIKLKGKDVLSLHLFQDDDCEHFTKKTINYAALEAKQRFLKDDKMSALSLFFGPLSRFIYRYFRLGSFTKGGKGFVYAVSNLIYDMQVSIILWELNNGLTSKDLIQKSSEERIRLLK